MFWHSFLPFRSDADGSTRRSRGRKSKRASGAQKRPFHHRGLALEPLEQRTLLAAGVVFETGFEANIALEPAGSTTQYWHDSTDSVTGYSVPADLPGAFRVNGVSEPVWQFVGPSSNVEVAINTDPSYAKDGSRSLKINQAYVSNSRAQLNLYPTSTGAGYDDFNETMTKQWVYFDLAAWPETEWLLTQEWFGAANRIIMFDGGMQFLIGGTSSGNSDRYLSYTANSFPLQQWVELMT